MSKKQLIMESALELFAKQGFEATSVQQITEHAGISKGAFYIAFKSKDELIIGLIDHFLLEFISEIDHVVKNQNDDHKLLNEFYTAAFHSFQKHSDFAKIFIKEQTQTVNEDLISKMHHYDKLIDKIILQMLERLYGEDIRSTKYDLIFCVKGFINTYAHLFLFFNVPFNLSLLSQSLAEKTYLLARHSEITFISEELYQTLNEPWDENITEEQIIEIIEQKIEEVEESTVRESLMLLKQHVQEPSLSQVIVKGLLANLKDHPNCKQISYLLRNYLGL
ncbi:TetR/AcrR family transcriptional regulator [Fictibacillus phosphorivorans]|uniref:TetR/AcrR family transcriptional regulator n=1 Tax=Fictibacillus phosphorivorans TaxID=1221500 RepID=UPI00203C7E80|nr:TetR/AcrR family transcriptional regulator [Fictibacillus phosphorivorans]MCM3719518.1 TetR/AcrR family transcriptional regulator [Fictibacillus phosphorivorans]MCM3777209.1 TetR/AcrR family transcriptional regulator [Fictibacillus phosphorivorans]